MLFEDVHTHVYSVLLIRGHLISMLWLALQWIFYIEIVKPSLHKKSYAKFRCWYYQ